MAGKETKDKTSGLRRAGRVATVLIGSLTHLATFRILFGIDALAAAVVAFFLVWGLSDGSVSAFNILLWLALLCGVGVVLGVGL